MDEDYRLQPMYPRAMPLGFCMVFAKDAKQEAFYWKVNFIAVSLLGAAMLFAAVSLAYFMLAIVSLTAHVH